MKKHKFVPGITRGCALASQSSFLPSGLLPEYHEYVMYTIIVFISIVRLLVTTFRVEATS